MRLFSDKENKLIEALVTTKAKGVSAIQNLQAAKILRNEFKFFALKWTSGDNPTISIYFRQSSDEENKQAFNTLYYQVVDFIYFIKELEACGFVAIQTISNKKQREYSLLYDRENYIYNDKSNEFIPNKKTLIDENVIDKSLTFEEISPGVSALFQVNHQDINLDFANDLERYGLGIIYPLPLAEDYVNNGLKTLETRQYNNQFRTALWAAFLGGISAIAALGALFFTIATDNKPTTIDRYDLERIETAIKSNHLAEPIEVITSDTITVKQVQEQPISKSK